MQLLTTAKLKKSLWSERRKIALLGFMLLLFVSNLIGLVQFGKDLWPGINFSLNFFRDAQGAFTLPRIATSGDFWLLLASGLVLIVCLPLLSPIAASMLVLLLAIPPVWIAVANPYRSTPIPMQFNLLVLLVLFGINVLIKYFAETQERQKLLQAFSQYLPEQIVKELSNKSREIALEGESRFVTVMFCDLRNFTSMSEQIKPGEVVLLLNAYFTVMTDVLFKYGATIDKYMGDSIMAFWGAPIPQEDHVQRAILASFEMHKEISNVTHLFHALNLPTPTIGVGINSGMVNVGNMGSSHRLTYTVIGDAVNLAFRLQTATRDYHVGTIVGEDTATMFPDMLFRELDQVTLRGKTHCTRIYEPLCLKASASNELIQQIGIQQQALQLWYDKQHADAKILFMQLQRDFPDQQYYQDMLNKL
jgi:adenylate cyclase